MLAVAVYYYTLLGDKARRSCIVQRAGAFSRRCNVCRARETRSLVIRTLARYRLHWALLPGIFNNKGLSVWLRFNDWLTDTSICISL